MTELFATPPNSPLPRRRGRPPGARSKRSLDLAKFIEARFAGMTPGQQLAELAMVTAKQVREAGSMQAALAQKARELALELRCDTKDAMAILVKGLTELMPYVHQKRPIAIDATVQALPLMLVAAEGDMAQAPAGDAQQAAVDFLEDFTLPSDDVGRSQSDDDG